jgi:hypothetical protein
MPPSPKECYWYFINRASNERSGEDVISRLDLETVLKPDILNFPRSNEIYALAPITSEMKDTNAVPVF